MVEDIKPFVSVVIPVLNCIDDVEGCVAELRAQTYPADRFEILIVDNGSTDGTADKVRSLGLTCPVRSERGRSRALNTGLAHAQGDIICTTDISCRPVPEWIEEIVKTFDNNPEVGCVAGEIKLLKTVDNAAIRFQERSNYMSAMSAIKRTRAPYLPYADGANASFRKAVFDEIGPFEESFIKAADVEICYRLLFLTQYNIAFNERACVWEPGEDSLRALLKQRYRIGIGNVLLRARFPELYLEPRPNSLRERYWSTHASIRKLKQFIGFGIAAPFDQRARERFRDLFVSDAMAIAQTLGRREGRHLLSAMGEPPTPVRTTEIRRYLGGTWSVEERIVRDFGAP